MNSTKSAPEWSIEFNFDIPTQYRRTFHLKDGDLLLTISVKGRAVSFVSQGGNGNCPLGEHLDWIQECMESVRSEFGQ